MAATPYSMLNALAKVALDKRDLTLLSLHTELSSALCDPALQGHLRQRVFFVGRPTRPAHPPPPGIARAMIKAHVGQSA